MKAGEKESLKKFEPKYNVVAATIIFNRAIERGDYECAKETAEMCIKAQDGSIKR